ncbi:hypothetical protein ACFOWA_17715 [Pedobacter lithocola]|uniref:Uncharacterized protein n=1 Tax=Pedobacter lithocola TaxID=1908239 RepID=A0ABV8PCY3_9SPHI
MQTNSKGAEFNAADRQQFNDGLIETRWTESGEPYYVIRDGLDLEEFARLAKAHLEDKKDIAHDFSSKVINESGDMEVPFEYKSGWFLEGLTEDGI